MWGRAHPGHIGIASLRVDASVLYHILKGLVRETTIAAHVPLGLWEGWEGGGREGRWEGSRPGQNILE